MSNLAEYVPLASLVHRPNLVFNRLFLVIKSIHGALGSPTLDHRMEVADKPTRLWTIALLGTWLDELVLILETLVHASAPTFTLAKQLKQQMNWNKRNRLCHKQILDKHSILYSQLLPTFIYLLNIILLEIMFCSHSQIKSYICTHSSKRTLT